MWVPSYCIPTSKEMTEVTVTERQDRVNQEAGPSEAQNISFLSSDACYIPSSSFRIAAPGLEKS